MKPISQQFRDNRRPWRRSSTWPAAGRARLAPGAGPLWALRQSDDRALPYAGGTRLIPEYLCQKEAIEAGRDQLCQQVLGDGLDAAIADLLLARLTPLAVDTSLAVYEELHAQADAAERLRAQQVERARYAAELAQRRFLRVDPENRLVADVLEAEWNARLRELAQVQEEAARQQEAEQRRLSVLERQAIAELVDDFPRVWRMRGPPTGIANAWSGCCWKM